MSYFYDEEIGNYCYGGGNPMRPHRARMAYSLVDSYGLTQRMLVHRPRPREFEELTEFHADGEPRGVDGQGHGGPGGWRGRPSGRRNGTASMDGPGGGWGAAAACGQHRHAQVASIATTTLRGGLLFAWVVCWRARYGLR